MGKELYDKGSNVQLGPGLCIARVPTNGRAFEYISGEDPYLGYSLVRPLVKGIQSNNIIATAKHWVANNQESNRHGDTAVVDERTRFEIYYPPFEGAVEAGVGSFMCSYNLIQAGGMPAVNKTGNWSCENSETLNVDLKGRMNFSGFVMSDWMATHSTSIDRGLDQEMPGDSYMGNALVEAVTSGKIAESAVDDSVRRILTPMYANGLFEHYEQWTNNSRVAHDADVTSAAHSRIAREIAAASTVLLKNDPVQTETQEEASHPAGDNGLNAGDTGGGDTANVKTEKRTASIARPLLPIDLAKVPIDCLKDCTIYRLCEGDTSTHTLYTFHIGLCILFITIHYAPIIYSDTTYHRYTHYALYAFIVHAAIIH
jgi:beta-glucosidase-like glycosyl hydrolase